MVEAKAWLHPDWPDNYKDTLSPVTTYKVAGWTPLYGPEALAERDALRGPKVGVNCPNCGCRLPSDYVKPCPDCGTIDVPLAALKEKTDDAR